MPLSSRVPPNSPLVFVLPEGSERPSGGNLYNRALLDALGALRPIERISLADWRTRSEGGAPGLYFLDSLDFLDESSRLEHRRPGQYFGLLLHHLPSLEPDLSENDSRRAAEPSALAKFDRFLCTSAFTRELLTARGFPAASVLTVPPAAPAVRASARPYEPPLRALIVANLIARKAVLPLLEALALRGPAPDYRLVIAGRDDLDPTYAAACRAACQHSPALFARVRYAGEVPHERMADHYQAADLLLSPARMETFGMAIQEARAHGLALIVEDGGFASHHVQGGVNGFVVSGVESMVDVFLSLAADTARMEALQRRARESRPAPGYGWPEAARSFLDQLWPRPA